MHDLEVDAGSEAGTIALDQLQRGGFHLVRREAAVDLQQAQAHVEAVDVLPQTERLLAEAAGHLEHHVAEHQRGVEDGETRLRLGHVLAVEVDLPGLAHRRHLV